MVILFILVGGFVFKCVFTPTVTPVCDFTSINSFAALATAGVLELVFEVKGLLSIFRKKD